MLKRRDFILQAAAASGALTLGGINAAPAVEAATSPAKSLRMLILGGTGFIGPHHVSAAVARGHQVAVFNRGKREADLPAGVERLIGDRNSNLDAIRNRDWDAVLDLAVYTPNWVRTLGEAVKGRVGHYTFISTQDVYDKTKTDGAVTEAYPLCTYHGPDPYGVQRASDEQYGPLKVISEREAEKQFTGKTLVLRPGYIVGPGDPQWHLVYWPVRMEKAGEVLVAGDPSMPAQLIDIRDLADWSIRMIEKHATGAYNVAGPIESLTLDQLLLAARSVAAASVDLTWVPSSFLAGRPNADLFRQVYYWGAEYWGRRFRLSISRAIHDGLKMRPLVTTLADTLDWYRKQPEERQAELLRIYRKKNEEGGAIYEPVDTSWTTYLQNEKEVLAQWRKHASEQ